MKRLALRIRAVVTGITLASIMVTQVIPFRAFAEEIVSPQSDTVQNVIVVPVSDAVTDAPTDGSFLLPATSASGVEEEKTVTTAPATANLESESPTVSHPEAETPAPEAIIEAAPETAATTPTVDGATVNIDEVADDETDAIDLGDSQAELDAQKDFTGVIRQSKPYTCGPASLATLRTQLGDDTSEQDVLRYVTDISEEKGVSLLTLKHAGQMLGSHVFLKHWSVDRILSYIQETQDPVLIHDEKEGVGGHFSVIREYDAEKGIVELSDTEAGNMKYAVKDFEHIYTGDALVIFEGEASEILADASTDLSDDIAATIWGKYVPVSVIAAESSNSTVRNAAAAFAQCTRNALAFPTALQRNAQRKVCYAKLANTIGDTLNNSGEATLAAEYNIKYYADDAAAALRLKKAEQRKDRGGQLGTDSILSMLREKLSDNQNTLEDLQSQQEQKQDQLRQSDAGAYARKISLANQIAAKKTALVNPQTQKAIGEAALDAKMSVINTLQQEIRSGSFTQNGQTFGLGAVGSQVVAQSATYARLSANLSSRLASLDGQIAQAQRSFASAQSNENYYNAQASWYQAQANTAYNNYRYYSGLGWRYFLTAASYWSSYVYYNGLAYSARSYASFWDGQGGNYQNQIQSLIAQKNAAQTDVTNASAEVARLQRLKAFGEQEMQRKSVLLGTLQTDSASIKAQLEKINATIAQLKTDLATLQGQYNDVANAEPPLTTAQINQLNNEIASLKSRISSLSMEIESQKIEINGEADFERAMSNRTEVIATDDMRGALASALKSTEKTVAVVVGVGVIVAGGVAICVGTVAGCGPVIAAAGSVLGSTPVLVVTGATIAASTVNDASIVLTQKDVFGKEYTDAQWTSAASSLMTNGALIAGAGATKVVSTSISSLLEEMPAATAITGEVLTSSIADEVVTIGEDVWLQNWSRRGFIIDTGLGNNVGATAQGIDIFADETVTSIKSLDMNASTYQNASVLRSKVKGYVDLLNQYTGGNVSRNGRSIFISEGEDFTKKVLKLAIPDTQIATKMSEALNDARAYAETLGIIVNIVVVK